MTIPGFQGLVDEFELEAQERLGHVETLLLAFESSDSGRRADLLDNIKKDLHTLKGNSAMMGFAELQQLAHSLEDAVATAASGEFNVVKLLSGIDEFRVVLQSVTGKGPGVQGADSTETGTSGAGPDHSQGSLRVSFAALDVLMQQVADMVILRNRVAETLHRGRRLDPHIDDFVAQTKEAWTDLSLAHEELARTLDFIQDRVMQLRMVPLKTLFHSLNRIVHDEARRSSKQVNLKTVGGDTPLDKALLELASDALGHLVRNSIVHGIELPETRTKAGKPPEGTVHVVAKARGSEVRIEVADDGGGIDSKAIAKAAAERGIATAGDTDPYAALFVPGFSTQTAADISAGRGVGLSAVLEAVQRQGGQITVSSEKGRGTVFTLDLPLSVSIARALMLEVDGEEYALPLMHVLETARIHPGDTHIVNNAGVLDWRGQVVPLLDLGHHFSTASTIRDTGFVVLVHATGKLRGLVADRIKGIQEVVVNTLGPVLGHPSGIAGSTVLGDGRAILILDARALIEVEPFVGEPA